MLRMKHLTLGWHVRSITPATLDVDASAACVSSDPDPPTSNESPRAMSSPWVGVARTLGLAPYYACGSVLAAEGWQDLRRLVGDPIAHETVARLGDLLMVGTWRGTPVFVAQSAIYAVERGQPNAYVAQVFAPIEPPLHLGLSVQPQGSTGGGARLPDLVVGEPAFDGAFHVFAGEPDLVRPLFARTGQPPELVDALAEMAREGVSVDIVDDRVRIYVGGEMLNPQTLSAWLDGARWIAERLQRSSHALPRSTAREAFQHTMEELAGPLGLEVTREPMAHGTVSGVEVWVHLSSARGRLTTALVARIPSPVVQGLRIMRKASTAPAPYHFSLLNLHDALDTRRTETRTGFPGLDAALCVQGHPERELRGALLPLQERLLRANRYAEGFLVQDGVVRLALTGASHRAPSLEAALAEVVAIATGLSTAAVAPPERPYR